MADKNFGVKQVNFVGSSGAPKIESSGSGNLNIDAATVAISTNLTVGSDLEVDGNFTVNNTGYGFTVTTQTGFAVTTDGTGLGLGYDLMKVSGEHNETYQSFLNVDNSGEGPGLIVSSGEDTQPLFSVRGTGRGVGSGYRNLNGYDSYRPTQVGTAITDKAVSVTATIGTDDEIYQYYRSNTGFFDMDQDGVVSPSDVLIALRGVFGNAFNGTALTNNVVMGNGTYTNSDYDELYDRIQVMKNAPYDINVNVGVNTNILTNVGTGITQIIGGNDYPVGLTTFIPANTTVTGVNTVTGEVTISKTTTNTVPLTGVAVTFGMGSHGYGMWDLDGNGDVDALGDILMLTRMVGSYGGSIDPTLGGTPENLLNPSDYSPPRYGSLAYPRIGIGTVPVKVLDIVGDTRISGGELNVNSKLIVSGVTTGITTITGDVSIGSTANKVDITGAVNSSLSFEGGSITLDAAGIATTLIGHILRVHNSDDPSESSTLKVVSEGSKFTSVTRQTSPQVGTGITASLTFEEPSRDTDAEVYDYCWDNYSKFDVDGDGVVSSNDILYLTRYATGLETITTSITPPSTATRTTNQELKEWISRHESRTGIGTFGDSRTITGINTGSLYVHYGQYVSGDNIQSGTVISGIGQSTIYISKFATGTTPGLTTSITFGDGTYNVANTSSGTMQLYTDAIAITRVFYSNVRNPMEVDYPPVFTNSQYKVGIGSDNPKQILDVGGNVEISGILTANSLRGGSLDLSDTTFRRVAGIITDPVAADPGDGFAYNINVSADGNIICISSQFYDWPSYIGAGSVYVFDRSGDTYSQVGILSAGDDIQAASFFGNQVAMSRDGSTIVASAPYYDDVSAGVGTCGRAYVFERSGSTFTRTGILSASDQSDNLKFGQSLAISGDGKYIAVGAPDTILTDGNNQVYIYKNSGGTLSEVGIITAGDYDTSFNEFGRKGSLAFTPDASTLVIGNVTGSSLSIGEAHVYDRSGDTFSRVGVITGPSAGEWGSSLGYDDFGSPVAVTSDGKTIIVGSNFEDIELDSSGAVFVYDRLSDNTFSRVGILSSSYPKYIGGFGRVVSTNDSGSLIAVGAPSEDVSGISTAGRAYLFERRENTFTKIAEFTETDPGRYSRFGTDVKISPDSSTLAINRSFSSGTSGSPIYNGEVSVYDANSISNTFITETGKLSVGEPNPQKQFNVHGDSAFEGKIETSKGVVGSIRQVVGYSTDATFQRVLTAGVHNTINEMGVEINLSSASNKVLVSYNLTGEFSSAAIQYNAGIAFARVSSNYASGIVTVTPGNVDAGFATDPGSRNHGITTPVTNYQASNADSTPEKLSIINFLDSPNTTGIVTYYPTIYPYASGSWWGNRTVTDTNNSSYERFISYITLQEIVG